MKQYGLIGEKLGHSLSVPIHEAIWEKISLAASYRLIEIPRGELAAVVPELLCTLDGFNITVPYKTDVMPCWMRLPLLRGRLGRSTRC